MGPYIVYISICQRVAILPNVDFEYKIQRLNVMKMENNFAL